jgi:hypothetical protein
VELKSSIFSWDLTQEDGNEQVNLGREFPGGGGLDGEGENPQKHR